MKLRLAIIVLAASLAAAAYNFGEEQWTTVPDWAAAACWPSASGEPVSSGNLRALALLRDGALERRYVGKEDVPEALDITPDNALGLVSYANYSAILAAADGLLGGGGEIFSSDFCPDLPTYAFCSCAKRSNHNVGDLARLGCCLANLDISGVTHKLAWEGAFETNFVRDVSDAFGLDIAPSADPFGTTALGIIRQAYPSAQKSDAVDHALRVAPVQNCLALLPHFNRTYNLWDAAQFTNEAYVIRNVSYHCRRVFTESGTLDVGENATVSIGGMDVVNETVTSEVYGWQAKWTYTSSEGIDESQSHIEAVAYAELNVGRGEEESLEDWEANLPTVSAVAGMATVDVGDEGTNTTWRYHRESLGGGDNEWSTVNYDITIYYDHTSTSDETYVNPWSSLFWSENDRLWGIYPSWQSLVGEETCYLHASAARDDFINGERQSVTNVYHATVSGDGLKDAFTALADAARENSKDRRCDTETRDEITVLLKTGDIADKPPKYAAIYRITDAMLEDDPDAKVEPCGIYIAGDGAHVGMLSTVVSSVPGHAIQDAATRTETCSTVATPLKILRSIDWNFKSITK